MSKVILAPDPDIHELHLRAALEYSRLCHTRTMVFEPYAKDRHYSPAERRGQLRLTCHCGAALEIDRAVRREAMCGTQAFEVQLPLHAEGSGHA